MLRLPKSANHDLTADQLPGDLESGARAVGCIFASPLLLPTPSYRATSRDPLIVVLPQRHRLADEQCLIFKRYFGPMMFDLVVSTCMRHGFSPRIFPARQMHTFVSLVSGGIGVAPVPACVEVMRREGGV